MAPRKRNTKPHVKDDVKMKKVEAFLQDFDGEVKTIVERLKVKKNDLLRKSQNAYDMALIKLPKQIRQMNWLEYYRSEKAKELTHEVDTTRDVAAKVDTVLAVVHDIPQPVKKTVSKKKAPTKSSSEEEENNPPLKAKKGRTAKKPPPTTSKKAAALSKQNSSVRKSNRKPLITPARNMMDSSLLVGATPLVTPRFDPRLPKTPQTAGRFPRHKERLYSCSANGSPVALATEDVVVSVPLGNGEVIQLLASQMDSLDFTSLDENALRSIQQLQSQLAALCGASK